LPYREFLARIRRMFDGANEHYNWIADGFADGSLRKPAEPMTDQELAEAIREFQKDPPSVSTLRKLGSEFCRKR